jgi:hypothetical protein
MPKFALSAVTLCGSTVAPQVRRKAARWTKILVIGHGCGARRRLQSAANSDLARSRSSSRIEEFRTSSSRARARPARAPSNAR